MPQIRTLLGCDLKELEAIAEGVGAPRYAGGQLAQWLYVKRVTSFEAMTNLSLAVRKKLAELYTVGREAPSIVRTSRDGTKKYLFLVECGNGHDTRSRSRYVVRVDPGGV